GGTTWFRRAFLSSPRPRNLPNAARVLPQEDLPARGSLSYTELVFLECGVSTPLSLGFPPPEKQKAAFQRRTPKRRKGWRDAGGLGLGEEGGWGRLRRGVPAEAAGLRRDRPVHAHRRARRRRRPRAQEGLLQRPRRRRRPPRRRPAGHPVLRAGFRAR